MTASTQQADDKSMRIFTIPSHELARISIVRNSTRFHNPPTKKLMDILDNMDTLYVYDVLIEDIHRGASPKYDPDGTIPVIKT
jgi:type I restriction enzyme S subunit